MTAQIGYVVIERDQHAFAAKLAEVWHCLGPNDKNCLSAWLENPECKEGLCLRDADVGLAEAQQWLAKWPQGRIFGSTGELRWECLDNGQLHLVLTSDNGVMESFVHHEPALNLEYLGDEELFLWGTYDNQEQMWHEDRIPKLCYPELWCGTYARLCTRAYEHVADMQRPYDSRIVRYVGYSVEQKKG